VKPLWEHQIKGLQLAEIEPDVALFFEQGTGKTRTCIEIIRRRFANKERIMRTVIFCPKIVTRNWKDEILMFSKIRSEDIIILKGDGKQRLKDFKTKVEGRNKIIITNYETVQMKELYDLMLKWQPEILVADESQRLKSPTAVRAKAVAQLALFTEHNYILSGTPILNSPADVFQQFKVLDRGKTFGANYYAFKAKYFEDKNAKWKGKQHYFPKWEPTETAAKEIQELIKQKSLRVLKTECLDLPPLVRQRIDVEMSTEQKRMHDEMMKDFVTWFKSQDGEPRAVVANLALTKMLRMQQMLSGFAKADDGTIHRIKECPRLDALEELLEDLTPNHKVIVWSIYHENYDMIKEVCNKLKVEYREVHGKAKDTIKQMKDFREDPKVRVMIANQKAGGTGVNLVEASYSIYYSKGHSLEDELQSEARNHRSGSEIHEKVTRIDLVCPGTMDELINESLTNKQTTSDSILTWAKELCTQFDTTHKKEK